MDGNGDKEKKWSNNHLMDKVKKQLKDSEDSVSASEHRPSLEEKSLAVSSLMQNRLVEDIYQETSHNMFQSKPEFVTSGPNPVRITEEELQKAVGGLTNMVLAHEIAVNRDFQLSRPEPDPQSLEFQVSREVKRAFWDLFEENLNQDPPNYNQALALLREMRFSLLSLLLPHNTTLQSRITEVLDISLIEQQVKNNVLDFQSYAEFIIDTLSKLCCPSRDPYIANLKSLSKSSEIFKGIFELIDLMRLDMANYFIQLFRPNIIQHSISYERAKFAEFIELEYKLESDGLRSTREWLARNSSSSAGSRNTELVIAKAFSEALTWSQAYPWPETLALDTERYARIGDRLHQIAYIGTLILQSGVIYQPHLGAQNSKIRDLLKKHAFLILPAEDIKDKEKAKESLLKIAEETIKLVNAELGEMGKDGLTEEECQGVRDIANSIQNESNKVKSLFVRRILDFLEALTMVQSIHSQVPIPAGLVTFQGEVVQLGIEFQRLVVHNCAVYKGLYVEILRGRCGPPSFPSGEEGEVREARDDPSFISILSALQLPITPSTNKGSQEETSPSPSKTCPTTQLSSSED